MEPGFYYAKPRRFPDADWRPVEVRRWNHIARRVYQIGKSLCEYSSLSQWDFGPRIPDYKPEEGDKNDN